jgi:membrane protein implicated in regulation of membrane protease activity
MAISLVMLVAGMTVLKDRLQGLLFIYYWLLCAMFTCVTLMIALLDFRATRRRLEQERSQMIQEMLHTVARDKARKAGDTDHQEPGPEA